MTLKDVNIRLNGEMGALLRQRGVRSVNRWVNDLVAGHLGEGVAKQASPAIGKNGIALTTSAGTDQAWFMLTDSFELVRVVKADADHLWLDVLDVDLTSDSDHPWNWIPRIVPRSGVQDFLAAPRNDLEALKAFKDFLKKNAPSLDPMTVGLGIKLIYELQALPERSSLVEVPMTKIPSSKAGYGRGNSLVTDQSSNREGRVIYADISIERARSCDPQTRLHGDLSLHLGGGYQLLTRDRSRKRNKSHGPTWSLEPGETKAVIHHGTALVSYPMMLWPNSAELRVLEESNRDTSVEVSCKIWLQETRPETKPSPPFTR